MITQMFLVQCNNRIYTGTSFDVRNPRVVNRLVMDQLQQEPTSVLITYQNYVLDEFNEIKLKENFNFSYLTPLSNLILVINVLF